MVEYNACGITLKSNDCQVVVGQYMYQTQKYSASLK
jgi:hypothetical protein